MAIKTTTNIDIDFCDKKYVLVNAKQLDKNSRFLSVTCYNHGELFRLNDREHASYIRYRKADDYGVFNFCKIEDDKIIVEITEQMLAVEGVCVADLVIVGRDQARVDDTGAITNLNEATVLSTMPIYFDVIETAVNNSEIESSYEYSAFNQNLANYWKRFEDAIESSSSWAKTSESWAVGGTNTRTGENTNNSKHWASESNKSATSSAASASEASGYMSKALEYKGNAETYMNSAKDYMDNASGSATAAAESAESASDSAKAADDSSKLAKASEEAASNSETEAKKSENAAAQSKSDAAISETNASNSADSALNNANRAQSYAVGGTGTRDGEDTNNAQWYYNEIKDILNGVNIVFVPKGTVYFSELAVLKESAVPGYIYNIKDDFVTDDSFREGSGVTYTAGVNVYYIIDENGEYKWDCFGGAASPTATVDEIKDYLGI